ncbi:MAG: type II toxin-antitoxin system Phd/YefM family antitoxin [Bryobacterales bacterium]|nr:type II toxin-antitoxin system Phd/YefM family antitoxin [Bryobacterales bacterium]MBV9400906.1 type II toxin-antitoxin system Phd/YefM family antitoxin [Bryobacterales bacterium]
MKTRTVSATEFKAKCLGLLDEVQQSGDTITVTKRGHPVAVVKPAPKKYKSLRNRWAGKIQILGDIVNFDTSHLWEALKKD